MNIPEEQPQRVPMWQPYGDSHNLERAEYLEEFAELPPVFGPERPLPPIGESELGKLVTGPEPSRAKSIWGFFDRILRFFGLSGPRVNMDLLHAIHSDKSLSSYYKLGSMGGDMLGFLKKLRPSKTFGFVHHFAENMRKNAPDEISEEFLNSLKEAKLFAKDVQKLKADLTLRQTSMEDTRSEWAKKRRSIASQIEIYRHEWRLSGQNRIIYQKNIDKIPGLIEQAENKLQNCRTEINRENGLKSAYDTSQGLANEASKRLSKVRRVEEGEEPHTTFIGKDVVSNEEFNRLTDEKNFYERQAANQLEALKQKEQEIEDVEEEKAELKSFLAQNEKNLHDLQPDSYYENKIAECQTNLQDLPQEESAFIQKRKKAIENLSHKMASRIQGLNDGEKVIFSYSRDPNEVNWSLVQVIKKGDSYAMEVIGISSDLAQFEANVVGKRKKERIAVYEGFKPEDLDTTFWDAVLIGQVPKGAIAEYEEDAKQKLGMGNRDLKLETIIEARMEQAAQRLQVENPDAGAPIKRVETPFESVYGYGQERETSTAMRTLSIFLKVNARARDEHGNVTGLGSERAKIALGLSALREFYSASYYSLASNRTQRNLVEKAVDNLQRQAEKAISAKRITQADLRDLNADLDEIKGRLEEIARMEAENNPLHNALSDKLMTKSLGQTTTHSLPKGIELGVLAVVEGDYEGPQITADDLKKIQTDRIKGHFEDVSIDKIPAKLSQLRQEAVKLYQEGRYEKLTSLIAEVFDQLPFDITSNSETQEELEKIDDKNFEFAHRIKRLEEKQPGVWNKIKDIITGGFNQQAFNLVSDKAKHLMKLKPKERQQCLEVLKEIGNPNNFSAITKLNSRQQACFGKAYELYQNARRNKSQLKVEMNNNNEFSALSEEEKNSLSDVVELSGSINPGKVADLKNLPLSVISTLRLIIPADKNQIKNLEALSTLDFESYNLFKEVVAKDKNDRDQIDGLLQHDLKWFMSAKVTSTWLELTEKQRETLSREISRLQQIFTDGTIKSQLMPNRELLLLKSAIIQDHLLRSFSQEYFPLAPRQLKEAIERLRIQRDPARAQTSDYYQDLNWRGLADQVLQYADTCGLSAKDDLHAPKEGNNTLYERLFKPNDLFTGNTIEMNDRKSVLDQNIAFLDVKIKDLEQQMEAIKRRLDGNLIDDKYRLEHELDRINRKVDEYDDPMEITEEDQKDLIEDCKRRIAEKNNQITQAKNDYVRITDPIRKEVIELKKFKSADEEEVSKINQLINSAKDSIEALRNGFKKEVAFKQGDSDREWAPQGDLDPPSVFSRTKPYTVGIPSQLQDLRVAEVLLDTQGGLGGLDNNFLKSKYWGGNFSSKILNNEGEYNFGHITRSADGSIEGTLGDYGYIDNIRGANINIFEKERAAFNYNWSWAWSQTPSEDRSKPATIYQLFDKTLEESANEVMNEYHIWDGIELNRLKLHHDYSLNKISDKQSFKAFLAGMNKPNAVLTDIMRVLEQYPDLIEVPAIRSLVEAKLLQRNLIAKQIESNPRFFKDTVEWFKQRASLNESPMDVRPEAHAAYLRYGVMFQSIIEDYFYEQHGDWTALDDEEEVSRGILKKDIELPFRDNLYQTLTHPFPEQFNPYIGSLWMLFLSQYANEEEFSGEQLMEIARGIAVVQNGIEDPQGIHRLMKAQTMSLYYRIEPYLQKYSKENQAFRNSLLDQMATVYGKRGEGEWQGEWPRFQNNNLFIDFSNASVHSKGGGTDVDFPKNQIPELEGEAIGVDIGLIRKWGLPEKALLQQGQEGEQVYTFSLKNVPETAFKLVYGGKSEKSVYREWKEKNGNTVVYELISSDTLLKPPKTEEKWLSERFFEYLGRETFLGELGINAITEGIKQLRQGMTKENRIPSFMEEEKGMSFWENPEARGNILIANKEGKIIHKVTLNENRRVETFEDFTAENPRVENVRSAIGNKHPALNELARFEDPQRIELFEFDGNLVRINMPRFGISFKYVDGRWACYGPVGSKLVGDFYLVERPNTIQKRGLPKALVLKDAQGGEVIINPQLITPMIKLDAASMTDAGQMADFQQKIMAFGQSIVSPDTIIYKLYPYVWDVGKAFIKNKIYEMLLDKDKKTLRVEDPDELLQIELKHPDKDQQIFQVFKEDKLTKQIRHIGGNSDNETDVNTAYFELMQQAFLAREPLHALTYLRKMQFPISPDVAAKLVGLNLILDEYGFLLSPNERTLVLKAFLQFKELLPHLYQIQSLFSATGKDAPLPLKEVYNNLLKGYAHYLANNNKIERDLQLTPEEHRFLLSIANKISPEFAEQHGTMIKDLIHAEELRQADIEKLSEMLSQISEVQEPTNIMESASKQFLDLITVPPPNMEERKEKWVQVRSSLIKASLVTRGEEKDFFTTLDRFAEYAMDSSGGVDPIFQDKTLPTLEEMRGKQIRLPGENANELQVERTLKESLKIYFALLSEAATAHRLTPVRAMKVSQNSLEKDLSEAEMDAKIISDIQKLADYQAFCPDQKTLIHNIEVNAELLEKRLAKGETFSVKKGVEVLDAKYIALSNDAAAFFNMNDGKELRHTDEMLQRLDEIINNPEEESSVQEAAKELKASLELAAKNNSIVKIPTLKDDQIEALKKELNDKLNGVEGANGYHQDAEAHKKNVEELLLPPGLSEEEKALLARRKSKPVDFEDVMKAYLQGDLSQLKMKLHPGADFNALWNEVHAYLLDATMEQRANRCLKSIADYEKAKKDDPLDNSGVATASVYSLYADLLGERQYDPDEHPDFMIFELKANILIRENQLPVLEALVKDPNSVKQAVTGIGKTSVILLLVALLKAQPGQLSMLYFPRELFEDNTGQMQLKLGSFFERNVYELRYPPSKEQLSALGLPAELLLERPNELDPQVRAGCEFAIVYNIYNQLIKTSIERGVVTSMKESALGLQSRYKALLKKICEDPTKLDPIEAATVVQLSKILMFLRQHGVQLTDEVDRICDVKDKFLRATPSKTPIPEFKTQAVLEVFDALLEVENESSAEDKTHVLENGQQDIKDDVRLKALRKTAQKLSARFKRDGCEAIGGSYILNYLMAPNVAESQILKLEEFKRLPENFRKQIFSTETIWDPSTLTDTLEFNNLPRPLQIKIWEYLEAELEIELLQNEVFQKWPEDTKRQIINQRRKLAKQSPSARKDMALQYTKDLKNESFEIPRDLIFDYFMGKEGVDHALIESKQFSTWSPEKKDALKVQQELFTEEVLKRTLSAKEGLTYGRFTKGDKFPKKAHEVVPYRLGLPRNNARHGTDLEVISYTIQYYFQKGPPDDLVEKWLGAFLSEANKELTAYKDARIVPKIEDLKASKKFNTYFSAEGDSQDYFLLSKYLGDNGVKRFITDLKNLPPDDPKRIRFIKYFLADEVLPLLKISPSSTEDDASGFLSMHNKNSGASATIGGLMGIKALNIENAEDPEALGRMMMLFLENGPFECKEYDPHQPENLIKVIQEQNTNEVFIDGAGIYAGTKGEDIAFAHLNRLIGTEDQPGTHPEIKGVVFWNEEGLSKVAMKDKDGSRKITTVEASGLKKHELGMYCDYARSRGADQPLGIRAIGSVTVNEMADLDGLLQAKGRMRGEAQGQGTQAWVPKGSGMKDKVDVNVAALRKAARIRAENLERRITADQMRNVVHDAMMERMLLLTSNLIEGVDFDSLKDEAVGGNVLKGTPILVRAGLLALIGKEYNMHGILGSDEDKPLKPGEYFEKNKMLSREVNALNAMEETRQRYLKIAKESHLTAETLEGAFFHAILTRDASLIENCPEDAYAPYIKMATKKVKEYLDVEKKKEELEAEREGGITGFFMGLGAKAKAGTKMLAFETLVTEKTLSIVTGIVVKSLWGEKPKEGMIDRLIINPLTDFVRDTILDMLGQAVGGRTNVEELLKMFQENKLFPPSITENAAKLSNPVKKLNDLEKEWKTEKWRKNVLPRLPKKSKAAAEADQAKELEAEEEREEELEAELEQEALQLQANLERIELASDEIRWRPWIQGTSPIEELMINADPTKNFALNLEDAGGFPVKKFFRGVFVSQNVTPKPRKSNKPKRIFPTENGKNPKPLKPVNVLLVTIDNGKVHTLGLDGLDVDHAMQLLEQDREKGKESGDGVKQAYLYDMVRRKVIGTGKNNTNIPEDGTPEEIEEIVLKYRLLNLEVAFKESEKRAEESGVMETEKLSEIKRLENLFKKSFTPEEFINFKEYFETQMLRLNKDSNFVYGIRNLKELMQMMATEKW